MRAIPLTIARFAPGALAVALVLAPVAASARKKIPARDGGCPALYDHKGRWCVLRKEAPAPATRVVRQWKLRAEARPPSGDEDVAHFVARDRAGRVYLSLRSFLVARLDATGQIEWRQDHLEAGAIPMALGVAPSASAPAGACARWPSTTAAASPPPASSSTAGAGSTPSRASTSTAR